MAMLNNQWGTRIEFSSKDKEMVWKSDENFTHWFFEVDKFKDTSVPECKASKNCDCLHGEWV